MSNTRKIYKLVSATVLLAFSIYLISIGYARNKTNTGMIWDVKVQHDAENTLLRFLDRGDEVPSGLSYKGFHNPTMDAGLSDNARMTQRVTVISDEGVLPISGTVSKAQDAYYPGTYELKFSNRVILLDEASVRVSLNVEEGEKVYILTGNRTNGYREYKVVEAVADNVVEFGTCIIQDFTISTTDITSAQEALASLTTY